MAPLLNIGLNDADIESVRQRASQVGTFNKANRVETSTVCLTGPVGVGKSSFIITVASALTGCLEAVAGAGSGTESYTRESHEHVLEFGEENCSWKIRDTRGDLFDALVDARDTRLSAEEIQSKLKIKIPAQYTKFDCEQILKAAYKSQVENDVIEALLADNTGCIVVLLSANSFTQNGSVDGSHWTIQENSVLDSQLKVLRWLHTMLHKNENLCAKGMRVICVLTQVDVVDEDVRKDTNNVENSMTVHQLRQCVVQKAGLPLNQVWPCVNLVESSEPYQQPALCQLALYITTQALNAAKHYNPPSASKHAPMESEPGLLRTLDRGTPPTPDAGLPPTPPNGAWDVLFEASTPQA